MPSPLGCGSRVSFQSVCSALGLNSVCDPPGLVWRLDGDVCPHLSVGLRAFAVLLLIDFMHVQLLVEPGTLFLQCWGSTQGSVHAS